MSFSPIEKILPLLNVKSSRGDMYRAVCPVREHRSGGATLSIKASPDGKVVIHCHAGCEPSDIVGAIGLQMTDLFPTDIDYEYKPDITKEKYVLEIARHKIKSGEQLSQLDLNRTRLAIHRVKTVEGMK